MLIPEILVCQSSSCRGAGAEAVFLEIEELASAVSAKCSVRESGCLGLCNQAPAALVVKPVGQPGARSDGFARGGVFSRELPQVRLRSVAHSAKVVELATGEKPQLESNPALQKRLEGARGKRKRDHNIEQCKWNAALQGFKALNEKRVLNEKRLEREEERRVELELERADLLKRAGFCAAALAVLDGLEPVILNDLRGSRVMLPLLFSLLTSKVGVLGRIGGPGRAREIEAIGLEAQERLAGSGFASCQTEPLLQDFARATTAAKRQAAEAAAKSGPLPAGPGGAAEKGPSPHASIAAGGGCGDGTGGSCPAEIDGYSQWTLEKVTPVSRHSAIFSFSSKDRKRGTPHPRGRGKVVQPKTWHTTLLAWVYNERGYNEEEEHGEGPLPWIERDYTPISTAKEWESGKCDILIKIYGDGLATQWLHGLYQRFFCNSFANPCPAPKVWLSQPHQTLSVPGLTERQNEGAFRPASVLLVLAGTGIVALPQLLAHRDPMNKLGVATRRPDQLPDVPMHVIASFRSDDALLLAELVEWCRQGVPAWEASRRAERYRKDEAGVRQCVLLLTEEAKAAPPGEGAPGRAEHGEQREQPESFPFPNFASGGQASAGPAGKAAPGAEEALAVLRELPNCSVLEGRLSEGTLEACAADMPPPCRAVVSGPGPFNTAVREMLLQRVGLEEGAITILTA